MPLPTDPSRPRRASRRTLLTTLGAGVLGAGIGAAAPSAASAEPSVSSTTGSRTPDPATGVDVRDHGAVPGGEVDCTDAFARAIAVAGRSYLRVLVPAGTWKLSSVTIPKLVKIVGLAADVSYFASPVRHSGGVNLLHAADSTEPMLVVDGHGISIENTTLCGNGSSAPLIRVQNGFESRFARLRLVDVRGTALHVEKVNNNVWNDISINACGTETEPAMRVKSPPTGANSNSFTCSDLVIEQSPGPALDLGWGDRLEDFVEFVRINALHVEGSASVGAGIIRVGNVRSVDLVDPFVYGGPAPLLVHDERRPRSVVLSGGIRIVGGTLLGQNIRDGQPGSDTLVRLARGDDFAVLGTRLGQFKRAAVSVSGPYGTRVHVPTTTTAEGYAPTGAPARVPLLDDARGPATHQ